MKHVRFEWDHGKARQNLAKHGVSFEDAATVFEDDNALFMHDPDNSDAEDRFLLLGISASLRLLIVCHCYRKDDTVIRLISARKADKHENQMYWSKQ